MWLIRRNQPTLLQKTGDGYIIDVKRFHAAVRASLNDYLSLILEPKNSSLRSKLWDKMNYICRVREARGVLYEAEQDCLLKKELPIKSLQPTASGG